MIITIDGLGVNGKSTVAKMISQKIGFKHFNTGAIYRCIALEITNRNLNVENIDKLLEKISPLNIDFADNKIYLNGKDVTAKVRSEKISVLSNEWATIPEIKQIVREIQFDFLKNNNTVIEGRDIATRIAPYAEIKFYLYSDFETRVERLRKQNPKFSVKKIRKNLKIRDEVDINKGNFVKPENAIEIDTTNKNIEEVFHIMLDKIQEYIKNSNFEIK